MWVETTKRETKQENASQNSKTQVEMAICNQKGETWVKAAKRESEEQNASWNAETRGKVAKRK